METWSPSTRFCQNCGKKIIGYRNKEGLIKVQCPYCNVRYVCKKKSRRKEVVEIIAPNGEEFTES